MKLRTLGVSIMFFAIVGMITATPAYAQTTDSVSPTVSDIIVSLLDQSSNQINQQIEQLESTGIEIPAEASTTFDAGLAEYTASLEALEDGDLDIARERALEALSLFEDALEELIEADNAELGDTVNEINHQVEDIIDSEIDAEEIRNLVEINELDFSLDEYDASIQLAKESLASGDISGSKQQMDLADDLLDDILDQIEYKAEDEDEQDERLNKFVEDTVEDLEDIIDDADDLGLSASDITQLETFIEDLQDTVELASIFEITGEDSVLADFFC